MDQNQNKIGSLDGSDIATLAGGCFWCLEAVFSEMEGVHNVTSGYTGGSTINPSYEDVSTGKTGHAESVQIEFDPRIISFEEILKIFFTMHNPTTMNRQGFDVGSQYRSAIFHHSDEQKKIALSVIRRLDSEKIWGDPIVTEVTPFEHFYKAEDYHQGYYEHNQQKPYCQFVINPKVAKLRKEYYDRLKKPSS